MVIKNSDEKKPKRKSKQRRVFSAREKSEAVLSIWTERRKPSQVCREMAVNWATINGWQNRALEGMLTALEPQRPGEKEQRPRLGSKLEKLLEKKSGAQAQALSKLSQRLESIQQGKTLPG